ncbi:hypothetical protein N8852_01840, partial [Candidatus Pelagibacter ubique]|nr:hypothetical protein [Candidatus Pelagibacter ubique]
MNIIISGGFGHIGSFLIKRFQNDRKIKNVLIIDNFSTQRFSSYLRLNKKKFKLIDNDLNKVDLNAIK